MEKNIFSDFRCVVLGEEEVPGPGEGAAAEKGAEGTGRGANVLVTTVC